MLGATYCASNPPDAATQAILAARGEAATIIQCNYSTGQTNAPVNAQGSAVAPPSVVSPTPYSYSPASGLEDCSPLDSACVQRNTQRQLVNEVTYGQTQANYNRQVCINNAALNGYDGSSQCYQLWPDGYSGNTPAVNAPISNAPWLAGTVPNTPGVPLATDVSNPANSNLSNTSPARTGTTPTSGSGSGVVSALSNFSQGVADSVGISNTTLLVVAGVAALFLMSRR